MAQYLGLTTVTFASLWSSVRILRVATLPAPDDSGLIGEVEKKWVTINEIVAG